MLYEIYFIKHYTLELLISLYITVEIIQTGSW